MMTPSATQSRPRLDRMSSGGEPEPSSQSLEMVVDRLPACLWLAEARRPGSLRWPSAGMRRATARLRGVEGQTAPVDRIRGTVRYRRCAEAGLGVIAVLSATWPSNAAAAAAGARVGTVARVPAAHSAPTTSCASAAPAKTAWQPGMGSQREPKEVERNREHRRAPPGTRGWSASTPTPPPRPRPAARSAPRPGARRGQRKR